MKSITLHLYVKYSVELYNKSACMVNIENKSHVTCGRQHSRLGGAELLCWPSHVSQSSSNQSLQRRAKHIYSSAK